MLRIKRGFWTSQCPHGNRRTDCDTCKTDLDLAKVERFTQDRREARIFADKKLRQFTSLDDPNALRINKRKIASADEKRERAVYGLMKSSLCACKRRPKNPHDWNFFPADVSHTSARYKCPHCRKIIMLVNRPFNFENSQGFPLCRQLP